MPDERNCLVLAARGRHARQGEEIHKRPDEDMRPVPEAREPRSPQLGELRDTRDKESHRIADADHLRGNLCGEPTSLKHAPLNCANHAILARDYVGRRVLLTDDDPLNREIAEELLRGTRLIIDMADSGAQAIEMTRTVAYDLILMDVEMPKIDGLETTRRIRDMPGRQAVPILAMTGAMADHRQRCFDAGMNDILIKPFRAEHICATLLKWLARTRIRCGYLEGMGSQTRTRGS
jgi:CheY-like chemotaxis protein